VDRFAAAGRARRPHPNGSSTDFVEVCHSTRRTGGVDDVSAHPSPSPVPPSGALPARPLVVSADERLLDDLLRVLAAAGAEPELATGGSALRRAHREAPLVLLGADVFDTPVVRALPRRPGVVVVATRELSPAEWAAAVELGAERVALLPADEGWLLARAATAVRSPVERGWLAAVGGSCGGAGASTLATALALIAGRAGPGVLLIDADPWGGGLDLLLGAERTEGLRWPQLTDLRGRVAGDALMAALPDVGGVCVLAASRGAPGPVPGEAMEAVIEAARYGGWPVVVDLPRPGPTGPDPVAEAVLADADLAVLVVPARLRAASAARALAVDPDGAAPWAAARLVVRPVPAGLSRAEVADVVGRPVLAELAHDRSAVPRGERGEPPAVAARSPLGAVARRVLAELPTPTGARR
jgi:secretion/DNA translocation related CpaE-like protein